MKIHPVYKNYLVSKEGVIKNAVTGNTLSQKVNEHGYHTVSVFDNTSSKYKTVKVHRLVAQTYVPNPDGKREVNHIDCNKSNNSVVNLEWVTSQENKAHAYEHGLYDACIGENHHNTNMSNDEVHLVCSLMEQGYRNKDICDQLSLEKHIVADIRSGRKWKHISKEYDIQVKRQNRKSTDKVVKVAMLLEQGFDKKFISQQTGVEIYDINRIKRRSVFKDLTKDFNF